MLAQLQEWGKAKTRTRVWALRVRKQAGKAAAVGLLALLTVFMQTPMAARQGLDAAALLKPATDTWPTYNGDYSGKRFSPLDQINSSNVGSLTLAWIFHPQAAPIKSTPLEVNGILYFTVPDNVWALDARF